MERLNQRGETRTVYEEEFILLSYPMFQDFPALCIANCTNTQQQASNPFFLVFLSARFSPGGTGGGIDISITHPQYWPQLSSYIYIQKVSKRPLLYDRYAINLIEPLPAALHHVGQEVSHEHHRLRLRRESIIRNIWVSNWPLIVRVFEWSDVSYSSLFE